jgi:hypothetical protein
LNDAGLDKLKMVKCERFVMLHQNSHDFSDVFREFLHDEDAEFRLRSLFWLSKRLERKDLEATLLAYVKSGTYFYDVVTWLGRLLYAPQSLRETFVRKLEQRVV